MHDICFDYKKETRNFNSFVEKMIGIDNQHRDEMRAMAFAFILYDFRNPHLRKILDDSEYWLALNHISGEYLTVFGLNINPVYTVSDNHSFRSQTLKHLRSF